MKKIDASIIIVNFNGKKYLTECLSSIYSFKSVYTFEVIVVDNNSTDGSIDNLEKEFPKVVLVKNKRNVGFGKANNVGARYARGEYLVFLNNDTVITKDWLASFISRLRSDSKIGGVVGKTMLFSEQTKVQNAGNIVFKEGYSRDRGAVVSNHSQTYEHDSAYFSKAVRVQSLCGVNMAVKKDVFFKLGGFSQEFFMYYEDVDLSLRIKRCGYELWFEPNAVIYHHHAATSREWSSFFIYQSERSRLLFLIKHYPLTVILYEFFMYKLHWIYSIRKPGMFMLRFTVLFSVLLSLPICLYRRFTLNYKCTISLKSLYETFY